MKKIAVGIFILTAVGLLYVRGDYGSCEPTWSSTFTTHSCPSPDRYERWTITWADGGTTQRENSAFGECCGLISDTECKPRFDAPYTIFGGNRRSYVEWRQTAYDRQCVGNGNCELSGVPKTVMATRGCPGSGGCNQCAAFSDAPADSELCLTNLNQSPGCCSTIEESNCTLNGGTWEPNTCPASRRLSLMWRATALI